MRNWLVIILFCCGLNVLSQENLRIGILENKNLSKIEFEVSQDDYFIFQDQDTIRIPAQEKLIVSLQGNAFLIQFKDQNRTLPVAKFCLTPKSEKSKLITIPYANAKKRFYKSNLEFTHLGSRMRIVQILPIDDYIAGVIEAEGGPNHELEYYKAQAVISRTYVLSQYHKHLDDHFNVCDQTHCQAYNGWPKHEQIMQDAAQQTQGMVIVDENANLITSAFHSNCGGRTNSAEYVWSRKLPYCVEKVDTFCMKMPNSNWEKRISIEDWKKYIASKNLAPSDSANYAYFPSEKEIYYREGETKIPLVQMRKDLKLKSTYFSVHQDGEEMVLIGQGFGHGVGLCQEGAMRMAELGQAYEDIIHFYYYNVKIIPFHYIAFFKQ
jgi:stage II sporulation protein D